LRAPRYKRQGGKIFVESKKDIKKRIGRSTDYADAVIQAWYGVNTKEAMITTIQIPDMFGR
jgi:hypothetical protein